MLSTEMRNLRMDTCGEGGTEVRIRRCKRHRLHAMAGCALAVRFLSVGTAFCWTSSCTFHCRNHDSAGWTRKRRGQGRSLQLSRNAWPTRVYIQDDDFGVVSATGRNQSDMDTTTRGSVILARSDETSRDYTGAGTLGDIMSTSGNTTTNFSGLVTAEGGLLQDAFGVVSPLDRMALTANGNLQRLFSSYYDAPVHVVVDKCSQQQDNSQAHRRITQPHGSQHWDRVVHLMVHNQTFCTARSNITVNDPDCQSLVASGKVGLGQLFRFLDKLPNFALLEAGYCDQTGGLWRIYQLTCDEVSCLIREDFVSHAWEISPQQRSASVHGRLKL